MILALGPVQEQVRALAARFARERLAPQADRLSAEEQFPVELLRECAGLGLLGVNVPRALGGLEAGPVALAAAVREIAWADASFTVVVSVTNMVAELLCRFGTEEQQRRFVPRLTSGEALCGAFALSEPQSASDAASMRTRATRVDGGWVLDGAKQWISHGAWAGVLVVWARTGEGKGAKGISAFIVEGGAPGMSAGRHEDKMGLRASPTVPLLFDGCRVPDENLLHREGDGFKLAMAALDGGRIGIASQACGVARRALDEAREFVKQRWGEQPEPWVGDRLAQMATELRAAELMGMRAAWLKEQGRPFTREASMAKVFASETAQRVCQDAVQLEGLEGALGENRVERLMRDARVQTIYEGASEIQRLVIARDLLK